MGRGAALARESDGSRKHPVLSDRARLVVDAHGVQLFGHHSLPLWSPACRMIVTTPIGAGAQKEVLARLYQIARTAALSR